MQQTGTKAISGSSAHSAPDSPWCAILNVPTAAALTSARSCLRTRQPHWRPAGRPALQGPLPPWLPHRLVWVLALQWAQWPRCCQSRWWSPHPRRLQIVVSPATKRYEGCKYPRAAAGRTLRRSSGLPVRTAADLHRRCAERWHAGCAQCQADATALNPVCQRARQPGLQERNPGWAEGLAGR